MTTFLISEDQTQTMEGRSKLKIDSQYLEVSSPDFQKLL